MYAHCTICDYESKDGDSMNEVKQLVESNNGKLTLTEHGYTGECPHCGYELLID